MAAALPFSFSLDLARNALSPASERAFKTALDAAEKALADLLSARPLLELFSNLERTDDIEAARVAATALKENTRAIMVLGIGGSSLGGQALKDLAVPGAPEVLFFDNPDPVT